MERLSVPALFSAGGSIASGILFEYDYPWLIVPDIGRIVEKLSYSLSPEEYDEISSGVYAHKTAKISPSAKIDGPAIICEGAEIRHCAYIRGKALIGRGAVIGNSTEIKNSLLFDNVKAPHFNYVGDSVLGYGSHLGASAVTSNLKADKSEIVIKYCGGIKTGLKKLGAIIGDGCEIGCGCILNPGTVIGKNSTVYPNVTVRGVLPPDSICKNGVDVVYKRPL
ncbi:MAG: UDP-N-acetylglucosamine pyrophosphorylase [Clostridia bacterium]|nr:UDP-N-acetylglucosamine pyrophosphorylase [Clostridia bacterium]